MPGLEGEQVLQQQSSQEMSQAQIEAMQRGGGFESSAFIIEGDDLAREIKEVEIKDLPSLATEVFAFTEGLIFGPDGYDLRDSQQKILLMNLFSTAEGMVSRPNAPNVNAALKERARKVIRKTKKQARKEIRPLAAEEENTISTMMAISNQQVAHAITDYAFRQRMMTCNNAGKAGDLVEKDPHWGDAVQPDKNHWKTIFSGEDGELMDKVMREIVKTGTLQEWSDNPANKAYNETVRAIKEAGIKVNLYAEGFKSTKIFTTWLEHLLKTAENRMDIVWHAWRIALCWELPAQFGIGVDPEKNKYIFADPPIGSDFMVWGAHLGAKRETEWGLGADGTRVRGTKYPTHTGYPASLGKTPSGKPKIPPLCKNYLAASEVTMPGTDNKVSLWEIWWKKNRSLADPKFPWAETEYQPIGLDTDELPPASFGGWRLGISRAIGDRGVLTDIRSRPGLNDLANPEFFGDRARTWDKVLGTVDDKTLPEENPRAWWVLAMLYPHRWGGQKDDDGSGIYDYHYPERSQWLAKFKPNALKAEGFSSPIILANAQLSGFLRKQDAEWILNQLK